MDRVALSYNRREASRSASMIIIGYEGSKREPKYFNKVENDFLESNVAFIHPLPPLNGESAPIRVLERVKTFVEDPTRGVNIEDGDQVWFVLDVDRYPIEQYEAVKEYCDLDEKRFLAISNPSFEVWLWMHLDDPDNITSKTSKQLKNELHEKCIEQGFGGNWSDYIKEAIKRGAAFDTEEENFIPVENTSRVYKLLEELLRFKK
ncbi:RloB family protein [Christiangramia sabulilitoris]|uniref:RloB domain-containing protein n=1 Tax=Christiangramia sabulilitoris TaxID=2583991 RepID=A0A550I731_9FLAO|nr:RloB family protein [Christiangramia sabulilitoris]TRO66784.1 RloB domain-containing protein [Christiangramia sabulilitoris]